MVTFFFPPPPPSPQNGDDMGCIRFGGWWKKKYMMGLFSFFAINFLSFVPFQKEKKNMHNSVRKKIEP